MVKNPPANAGVPPLGQEYPLEKEMATQPSILAWRIPWTEEPGGLQSIRSQRVEHNRLTDKQQQPGRLKWVKQGQERDSDGSQVNKKGAQEDPTKGARETR